MYKCKDIASVPKIDRQTIAYARKAGQMDRNIEKQVHYYSTVNFKAFLLLTFNKKIYPV